MAQLSKQTIEKLKGLKSSILANPELYDQSNYCDEDNICGGACCLAGWAVWNDSPKKFKKLAETSGRFGDWDRQA